MSRSDLNRILAKTAKSYVAMANPFPDRSGPQGVIADKETLRGWFEGQNASGDAPGAELQSELQDRKGLIRDPDPSPWDNERQRRHITEMDAAMYRAHEMLRKREAVEEKATRFGGYVLTTTETGPGSASARSHPKPSPPDLPDSQEEDTPPSSDRIYYTIMGYVTALALGVALGMWL